MKRIYGLILIMVTVLVGAVIFKKDGPALPAIPKTAEAQRVPEEALPLPSERSADSAGSTVSDVPAVPEAGGIKEVAKPARIIIPSVNINTNIVEVGVTSTNNLDVPPNFVEVGWYKYGPKPGEMGSSVLDGHVDNGGSVPGPFKRLKEVKMGEVISIVDQNGLALNFKVSDISVYPTSNFPSEKIFLEKGSKMIKLITCHGTFVPSLDTYDQRLVVTAVLSE